MKPLPLYGRHLRALGPTDDGVFHARLTDDPDLAPEARGAHVLLVRGDTALAAGFRAYFRTDGDATAIAMRNAYMLGEELHHVRTGDVVRVDPARRSVNVLYRRSSPTNSILVTERCDNYCLMCSQPPKPQDDSYLVDEAFRWVHLVDPDTAELGITGGEPGLLGERLPQLVSHIERCLPRTALHVLSNGRRFADPALARALAAAGHHDLMVGIPLYSDLPEEHDYVVQARGAYSETLRGILALKAAGVRVEIRTVMHAQTFARLPELATFIVRNLLFVDHVALMGLELMGFARSNLAELWIDPVEYQEQLAAAVEILDRAGMAVSVYNTPLCLLPEGLHRFARQSISDWKNAYTDECEGCTERGSCAGFFTSSTLRKSAHIRPFGARTSASPTPASPIRPTLETLEQPT
ncbi:MAG: His-Xaa-Ser system radical SAM maturase HxsC [Myxococcales bacterium]|nr:His-Xaa-Ser system radical SAM maturase HxsC [Myxococcales bacterium]